MTSETTRRKRAYERHNVKTLPPQGDIAELTRRYLHLVHIWARRYARMSTGVIGWEDLVSVGLMGLVQAHRRFDPEAGRPFEVYAEFRIKGAIIDELRRVDPLSQPHRRKAKKLGVALQQLQNELGRAPDPEELAKFLNLPLSEVHELMEQSQSLKFQPVEEIDRHELSYDLAVSGWQRADLEIALTRAIGTLDKRNQTILSLYYVEGLAMSEIAEVLGVTEARISQLHSALIRQLREQLLPKNDGDSKAAVAKAR